MFHLASKVLNNTKVEQVYLYLLKNTYYLLISNHLTVL